MSHKGMNFRQYCRYRAAACHVDRVSERPEGVPRVIHLQVLASRARDNRHLVRGDDGAWFIPSGALWTLARFLVKQAGFPVKQIRDLVKNPEFGSEGEDVPCVR